MNIPNKLTVARIIATPVFMATMLINFKGHCIVSLLIFIAASLTDLIDGKLARKYHLVTDFGKFLDPLADKMLTTAAYLGFIDIIGGRLRWQIIAITFIVLFREFLVSSLRLTVVSSGGKVIAANIWGKSKTVSQMVGIIAALAAYSAVEIFGIKNTFPIDVGVIVLFWISAVLCVISGAVYLRDSKSCINTSK